MSVSVPIDERGLAWLFVRVRGAKGSAVYRACVDTGATYCVLSEVDCINLGLIRKGKDRVVLMTVKGEATAKLFVAPWMAIEGTELAKENVEVVAKVVPGFPVILGMSFLRHFNWSFDQEKQEFSIFKRL